MPISTHATCPMKHDLNMHMVSRGIIERLQCFWLSYYFKCARCTKQLAGQYAMLHISGVPLAMYKPLLYLCQRSLQVRALTRTPVRNNVHRTVVQIHCGITSKWEEVRQIEASPVVKLSTS